MVNLVLEEVNKAIGGRALREGEAGFRAPFSVSTDTRTLKAGEVFFALKGERYDAHEHLADAAARGAQAIVCTDAANVPEDYAGAVLLCADTERALGDLAAAWRARVNPFVIAVTGSVGKTTQKDMTACACGARRRTHATQGNFNNRVGLPKTIFEMPEDTEVLVLEMGLDYAGDIRRLAEIARPDACVITNIGLSHREHFDSDDGIRNAKFEITAYLGPGNLLVYRPEQDAGLAALAEAGSREQGYALVRIGQDYRVTETSYTGEGRLTCVIETKMGGPSDNARARFDLPIPAPYAAEAAAMAAAAAFPAGVSLAGAAEALRGLRVTPHRLQPIPAGDILVIDDTYNASPDSMRSGFAALAQLPAARRIAVLADMNELGEDSAALHFSVGEAARAAGFDAVYTTGEKAREIAAGAGRADLWFPDKEQLVRALFADRRPGDVYYVKGSRSMKMEEAVDLLAGGKGPVV